MTDLELAFKAGYNAATKCWRGGTYPWACSLAYDKWANKKPAPVKEQAYDNRPGEPFTLSD